MKLRDLNKLTSMTNALEYEITCCDLYEKNLAAENNKI
jgi:hypothetical protein